MKLGPNHEITADSHNWILTTWSDGKKKDGTPTRTPKNNYFPTLSAACERYLAHSAAEAVDGGAEAVIAAVDAATRQIKEACAGIAKDCIA